MEDARRGVADDEPVRPGRARGADDRPEVARSLDPLRHEHERPRARRPRVEPGRPALDDGGQAVRAQPTARRDERGAGELDDARTAALGQRDELSIARPEEELRRGVHLDHPGARLERAPQLPVPLDEEHPVRAPRAPAQPPERLHAVVRAAGDARSSCHCSCPAR
jgi:hypothetical protein